MRDYSEERCLETYKFNSLRWLFAKHREGRDPMLSEDLRSGKNSSIRIAVMVHLYTKGTSQQFSNQVRGKATNDLSPIWSICRNTIGRSSHAFADKIRRLKTFVNGCVRRMSACRDLPFKPIPDQSSRLLDNRNLNQSWRRHIYNSAG